MELENPYDITLRDRTTHLWDVAYYNGNYYVYFGILPALLLFVPYKILTGDYLFLEIGVAIFASLTAIFMIKLLLVLIKRWFGNLNFRIVFLSLIFILFSTFLPWIARRAEVYELVIVAGFYFVMQGMYCFFKAIQDKEKTNYLYLTFACISLALSVACRPTLLLISLLIVPTLIKIAIRNIKEKKNILKFIFSVGLPYMIIGIALMIYNYIRFDNILEFGANYQLTVNDMRNIGNRLAVLPMGIFSYLFKPIVYSPVFPFIVINADIPIFYGYYFPEAMAGGLIFYAPICFLLFFIHKFKNIFKENDRNKEIRNYIILMLVLGIILSCINIMLAGNTQRYVVDFAWLLIYPSLLLFYLAYEKINKENIKQIVTKIAIEVVLYTVIVNTLAGFIQGTQNRLLYNRPDKFYKIRYSVDFWE